MIRPVFFLIVVAVTIANASSAQVVTNPMHLERLRKFRNDYCQSLKNKVTAGLDQYLSENIRLMPEFQKTIVGRNNVIAYWVNFVARFDIEISTRAETEILDLGDRIFETGVSVLKMKLRNSGKVRELKGKYIDLWEKTDDRIQLITSAWNYDHAIDFHNELRFIDVPCVNVALEPHVPVKDPVSFELAALNRLMESVITQHDAAIWSQFYSDDGSFLYTGTLPVQGRKAIDEFFVQHAKDLPVFEKLDIRNDRIDELGEYIIEYASHIAIWRRNEYSGMNLGKDLRVWRREPNGSLKIFRHIGMYD